MRDYHEVADAVAADIASGKLSPGMRLPPQRSFAYAQGIAVSTASRVYAELARRGLVVGAVGRGTFVARPRHCARPATRGDGGDRRSLGGDVDVARAGGAARTCAQAVLRTGRALWFAGCARPLRTERRGRDGGRLPRHKRWAPEPANILFAGGGRQAIASAVAALCKPGDRVGVER